MHSARPVREWECTIAESRLSTGDILVLYTDGITEAFNEADEDYGEQRLIEVVERNRRRSSREILTAIVDDVRTFSPRGPARRHHRDRRQVQAGRAQIAYFETAGAARRWRAWRREQRRRSRKDLAIEEKTPASSAGISSSFQINFKLSTPGRARPSMEHVSYLLVLLIGLLFAVAAVAGLARRFAMSYPIALVIFGLLCSLIPRVPRIPLPPSIVFLVILPPLLYIAAWQTSWREFKYNLVSISSLAVLLVFFTAFGVAFAAQWWLPGFDWRLGFLLGAVVSPTDAVAATSIARKVGMPQGIVDLLEGESLLNDATGLLALAVWGPNGGAGNDSIARVTELSNSPGSRLGGVLVGARHWIGCYLARTLGGRWTGGDCVLADHSVRCLSGGRCGEGPPV